jgi:hypothetical protein
VAERLAVADVKSVQWQAPAALVGGRASRDAGKVYQLNEMTAARAEKWAIRAFMALSRSGFSVPDGIASLGIIGVFMIGFQSFRYASFAEIEPLMDEMMTCVKAVPDQSNPLMTRALVDSDTEEIETRWELRKQILELHAGFSFAEIASMLAETAILKAAKSPANSSDTQTSPD